jgi:hypothetical protein
MSESQAILHRCNVATMLLNCDILAAASTKVWHAPKIEVPNSFAQRVAIETENLCGLDLVPARQREGGGNQGRFEVM